MTQVNRHKDSCYALYHTKPVLIKEKMHIIKNKFVFKLFHLLVLLPYVLYVINGEISLAYCDLYNCGQF
jgi:hypothetical protein